MLELAVVTTLLLLAVVVALVLVLVLRRAIDERSAAVDRELADEFRPLVVEWLGDTASPPPVALERPMGQRSRVVLSSLFSRYGSMLRGESRARLVQYVNDRGYVEASVRELRSWRAWRRGRAAKALGDFGSARAVRHLSLLVVNDRDLSVRLAAARALGRIDDYKSAAALLMVLPTGRVPPGVVAQSLLDLGTHAFGALVSGCDDEDDETRRIACRLVGLIGTGASVDAVRTAHEVLRRRAHADEDPGVRAAALDSLARLGDARSEEVVRAALRDPDAGVRRAAAVAARSLYLREVADDLLELFARELALPRPDWRVVRAAAHGWGALAEALVPDAVPVDLREQAVPFLREAAAVSERSVA